MSRELRNFRNGNFVRNIRNVRYPWHSQTSATYVPHIHYYCHE